MIASNNLSPALSLDRTRSQGNRQLRGHLLQVLLMPWLLLAGSAKGDCLAKLPDSGQNSCPLQTTSTLDVVRGPGAAQLDLPACLSGSGSRDRVVIAIDRSATAGSLPSTRQWIEKIEESLSEELQKGEKSLFVGKLGLTMFSSGATCRPYEGGAVEVNGVFPCLYIEPKPLSDEQHRNLLKEFLIQVRGKFSQVAKGSDITALSDALSKSGIGAATGNSVGRVFLYTDGLFFRPTNGQDPYAMFRLESFANGRGDATKEIAEMARKSFGVIVVLPWAAPPEPIVTDRDALDTMCGQDPGKPPECSSSVDRSAPESWLVNRANTRDLLKQTLAQTPQGEKVSLVLDDRQDPAKFWDAVVGIHRLVDAEAFLNGKKLVTALQDQRLRVSGIPQDQDVVVELAANYGAVENKKVKLSLRFIPATVEEHGATTLRCVEVGSGSGEGGSKLGNFRGGGRKCGVVDAAFTDSSLVVLLIALSPIFLVLLTVSRRRQIDRRQRITLAICLLIVSMVESSSALAEPTIADQNLQTFSPGTGNGGLIEDAGEWSEPPFRLGLFADQASDPFSRRSESGERLPGSVERMSTAHVVGSFKIIDRLRGMFNLAYHSQQVTPDSETRTSDGNAEPVTGPGNAAGNGQAALRLDLWRGSALWVAAKAIGIAPLTKGQSFAADSSSSGGASLVTTLRFGNVGSTLELGRIKRTRPHEWVEGDLTYRIQGYDFGRVGTYWDNRSSFGAGISVSGRRYLVDQSGESRFAPVELDGGATWHGSSSLDLSLGCGAGIGDGLGSPSTRVFAGAVVKFGGGSSPGPSTSENRVAAAPAQQQGAESASDAKIAAKPVQAPAAKPVLVSSSPKSSSKPGGRLSKSKGKVPVAAKTKSLKGRK